MNATTETKSRRYPDYKDSGVEWLGEIPEHWEVRRLRNVTNIFKGGTPKRNVDKYFKGDIPWARPVDVTALHPALFIDDTEIHISEEALGDSSARLLPAGTVLLTSRATIGFTAITTVPMATNQGFANFLCKKSLHNVYLAYYLRAIKDMLIALGSGSTFLEVTKSTLKGVEIQLPPLAEQRAIANFLDQKTDEIDTLIAKKERLIELLQEKRKALISHAVTKGLDATVEMKDSGVKWLGEIPEHWEVKRLKYVCTKSAIYGANESASEYRDKGVRFLRTSDIDDKGQLSFDGAVYIDRSLVVEYLLNDGDILLSRSGTIGRSFLYKKDRHGECAYAGYLVRFVPDSSLFPKFAFYFTKSQQFADWLGVSVIESTIGNVNGQKYANMPLTLPPFREQRAIANYLDGETAKLDALTEKIREAIDKLKEYRTALISAAVTGKACSLAR